VKLNVAANNIGGGGFAALAEVLPRMAALEELDLETNKQAGSAGVLAVARAVPLAPKLRHRVLLHECGADETAVAEATQIVRDCGVRNIRL